MFDNEKGVWHLTFLCHFVLIIAEESLFTFAILEAISEGVELNSGIDIKRNHRFHFDHILLGYNELFLIFHSRDHSNIGYHEKYAYVEKVKELGDIRANSIMKCSTEHEFPLFFCINVLPCRYTSSNDTI